MPTNESPETMLFNKLLTLCESRGLEVTAPMRFLFWNDPAFRAIFCLIMELFEKVEPTSTWDPWADLES